MKQARLKVRIKTEDIERLNESGANISAYSLEGSQDLPSALIEVSIPTRWIRFPCSENQKGRIMISVPIK